MRSKSIASVAVALCAAIISASAPSAQGATKTVKGTFRCTYQKQVLTLVNKQRVANGRPALTMTKALTDVAMVRAAELSCKFSHTRPNGQAYHTIIPHYYNFAENMAKGQTTPADVMDSWMSSKSHRKDILTSDCSYIGIGCFVRDGKYYWIQVFSDSPGKPVVSDTRTGDKSATAKIALDTGSNSSVMISESPSGDFSGSLTVPYCTVLFNANGGKGKMAKQKVKVGTKFKLRKNAFTRSGYVFIGWAQSKNGSVVMGNQEMETASRAGTVKLYAKWAKENYKVAFNANGGEGRMADQTMTYGKAAKLRANEFTRKGYTFKGWAKSKNGKVAYKNKKTVKNLVKNGKTVKLYAVWAKKAKAKAKYITIKFNANGGKGKMADQKLLVKKNYFPKMSKNTFTRQGYVFKGWYWSISDDEYLDEAKVNVYGLYNAGFRTLNLNALWKKQK